MSKQLQNRSIIKPHLAVLKQISLTLSQWSSSGNPVAIQCAWNLDPSVHWNATGEIPVCFQGSSNGLPVAFQWSSSVFQLCKLTLDRHWDTTGCKHQPVWFQWHPSVLVAPVVFQCGLSCGIRVYTDRIWFGGQWVRSLPSMRPLKYTTAMVRVVWAKLISFDLQPQIHKNYNGAHIKGIHRVMLKYSHVLRAELASIAEQ